MTTPTTPATAWRYHKRGLLPVTLKKEEVELPALKPDEVLIKVYAAALNPVDWKIASVCPSIINKVPQIAGSDFSGEIIRFNTGVESQTRDWIKAGSKVYGIVPAEDAMRSGLGTLSTYTIAKCSNLAPIPNNMSYEDAAGITLVGLTAATLANVVKKGDRVLVLGGTTSVGLVLIQMCLADGVSLIATTASTDKISVVEKLGVHSVFDYRKQDVEAALKKNYQSNPFDHVFDCVGAFHTYNACPGFLKQTGTYHNVGASSIDVTRLGASIYEFIKQAVFTLMLPVWLGGTPRKYSIVSLDVKYMDQLSEYVSNRQVSPRVDSVFKFDEVPKAYEHLIKGRALGKVVVTVAST